MTYRRVRHFAAAISMLAAGSSLGGAASAALVATATVVNRYAGVFDGSPVLSVGGPEVQVFSNSSVAGQESSLGVQYVGIASTNSFFFLHNDYCVGSCATKSDTVITFRVTNTSDEAIRNVRFDSEITPGHLGRIGFDNTASAGFQFNVTQSRPSSGPVNLYSATGSVDPLGIGITTSDGRDFNGLISTQNGLGGYALDWSATNLDLSLGTLGAGQSTTIQYEASYFSQVGESCDSVTDDCGGAQVVFGDPRHNGTGTQARTQLAYSGLSTGPVRDIINRDYGAYQVPFAFVDGSVTPLPAQPAGEGPLLYGLNFTPPGSVGTVPEPSTWSSMIVGLGAIGCWSRSRRSVSARSSVGP